MLLQDIKFAIRSFAKSPGFTLVVLITLALGIGANTAIFTLVDAVLLRPLPVHEPSELADIWTTCRRGFRYCSSSYPDFLDYRDRSRSFVGMAAFASTEVSLQDGDARLVEATLTTGNYFSMLGVGAAAGRLIGPSDDRLGDPNAVIVLGHRMWSTDFGRDPQAVGRTVRLNGSAYTVIGVAQRGFRGTRLSANPDLWIPLSSYHLIDHSNNPLDGSRWDILAERNARWIGGVIGRRLPGVSVEQARADLAQVSDELQVEYASRSGRTITVEATRTITLPAANTGADLVRFVSLLMAVVVTSLLIACANIANLLLSRASARRREIGVRLAIGAGRGRLVRQLMTESMLLSLGGALAGLAVASAALKVLSGYALPGFVSIQDLGLHLDARVLAFTGGVAVATGVIFGLVPALQASNPNVMNALKESSSERGVGHMMRTRSILLTVQTALALVLLIGAGLFLKSLRHGLDSDVGFDTRNLAIATFGLSMRNYSEETAQQFLTELGDRAAALPGVRRVSSAVYAPLSRGGWGFFINIPGYEPAEDEELRIEANWVGPDYFATLGIPLLAGRDITREDRDGSRFVAVINETMAQRWWRDEDPVGRTFRMGGGGGGPEVLIVGLAKDVKDGLVGDPEPFIYYPVLQHTDRALGQLNLLVETTGPANNVLSALRHHIRELDPNLAVPELTTVENRFDEFLMPQRMGTTLLATLGALTVLLAIVGIAGVVGYAVNQRRREMGIRIALGASSGHVLGVALRVAIVPVVVGLGVGLLVSFGVTRLITSFMYDVAPTDVATFVGVPLLTGIVAALAAYVPARRATEVNPTEALRAE